MIKVKGTKVAVQLDQNWWYISQRSIIQIESLLQPMMKMMREIDIEEFAVDHSLLRCALCHGVMINAYISKCGCQFCRSCLDKLLESGAVNCPGRRQDCRLQSLIIDVDVFPDYSSNIKISRLKVLCPNNECGCVVEIRKMEEHLSVCKVTEKECSRTLIGCLFMTRISDFIASFRVREKRAFSEFGERSWSSEVWAKFN